MRSSSVVQRDYSVGEGNSCCQCQGHACSVLVFSYGNDGAFPLRISYYILS